MLVYNVLLIYIASLCRADATTKDEGLCRRQGATWQGRYVGNKPQVKVSCQYNCSVIVEGSNGVSLTFENNFCFVDTNNPNPNTNSDPNSNTNSDSNSNTNSDSNHNLSTWCLCCNYSSCPCRPQRHSNFCLICNKFKCQKNGMERRGSFIFIKNKLARYRGPL
jgi:hypothetical protein